MTVFLNIASRFKALPSLDPPRRRGFAPRLSDGEVFTLKIVGECLGHHHDNDIWRYFLTHWRAWFPSLKDRTTFTRQAANLWQYKQLLHQQLLQELEAWQGDLYRIDGFLMPVCGFKRAPRAKVFADLASYGQSVTKLGTFDGFRGHLLFNAQGLVLGLAVTAADVDERDVVLELVGGVKGPLLGDEGYMRQVLTTDLAAQELTLSTPLKHNMKQYHSACHRTVSRQRQLVETVIGHRCHWFDMERIDSRDLWHLTSRLARKILAHTLLAYFNYRNGLPCLHYRDLIRA